MRDKKQDVVVYSFIFSLETSSFCIDCTISGKVLQNSIEPSASPAVLNASMHSRGCSWVKNIAHQRHLGDIVNLYRPGTLSGVRFLLSTPLCRSPSHRPLPLYLLPPSPCRVLNNMKLLEITSAYYFDAADCLTVAKSSSALRSCSLAETRRTGCKSFIRNSLRYTSSRRWKLDAAHSPTVPRRLPRPPLRRLSFLITTRQPATKPSTSFHSPKLSSFPRVNLFCEIRIPKISSEIGTWS